MSERQGSQVFDLEQPRFQGMPVHPAHQPGYLYVLHRRHNDDYEPKTRGERTGASGVITCMEHSGTHIDALCHQAEALRMYGGVDAVATASAKGFSQLGVETIPPIYAPGVLLDLTRFRGVDRLPNRELVGPDELAACAKFQGIEIERGDVVLVRFGSDAYWSNSASYLDSAGVHGDGSRWLGDLGVFAVGADNMAWDVDGIRDETLGCMLPGHVELLARRGIYIVENLALAELAAKRIYEFTFVCTPLKATGATGSPVRSIAIV